MANIRYTIVPAPPAVTLVPVFEGVSTEAIYRMIEQWRDDPTGVIHIEHSSDRDWKTLMGAEQ